MNTTRRVLVALVVATCFVLSTTQASAGNAKDAADEHYEKGVTNYNLGRFRQAVAEFEQAYELTRAPILLFNIAQAYRQDGNTERALFFYRRYLSLDSKTKKKAEVEKRIKDLEELQEKQSEIKTKPPTDVEQNGGKATSATGDVSGAAPEQTATDAAPSGPRSQPPMPAEEAAPRSPLVAAAAHSPTSSRRPLAVAAGAGISVPVFSGTDLNSPVDYLIQLHASYAFPVGENAVEAGLKLGFSSLSYDLVSAPYRGKTSRFISVFATGGWRQRLSSALSLAGELGVGVVFWSGVVSGDPFTKDAVGADGSLTMPSFRIGASLRYDHPSGLFLALAPAYGYSIASSGMRFSSLQFVDALMLIGFAM